MTTRGPHRERGSYEAISAHVQGYGRIVDSKINLDAKVIAIVGPNEAGKTTLLKALAHVDGETAVPMPQRSRATEVTDQTRVTTFRLHRATALLVALRRWDTVRKSLPSESQVEVARALDAIIPKTAVKPEGYVVFAHDKARARALIADIESVCARRRPLVGADAADTDPWNDFLSRPADYFAMLSELGLFVEDEAKMHGDLSDEIIAAGPIRLGSRRARWKEAEARCRRQCRSVGRPPLESENGLVNDFRTDVLAGRRQRCD